MATISGTATKLSDSTAVVGGKITLINSDTNAVIATTTTGVGGAWEFTGVADGITVHVVGEWDDTGTLYNAKSQPFISTGLSGDPAALMTSYGVAADSVWIKADETATFTTVDDLGTLRITAAGSFTPAGISITSPGTGVQQPALDTVNGLIKFVTVDGTYLRIPAPFGRNFNMESATYTISVAVPVWGTDGGSGDNNNWLLSNRLAPNDRFQFTQGSGNPFIRAVGTVLVSYPSRPTYIIATWRVNNGTAVTDGAFRALLNNEAPASGAFTPVAAQFSTGTTDGVDIGRLYNTVDPLLYGTADIAELVIMPGAFLSDQDMDDLHQRMLTLYTPA